LSDENERGSKAPRAGGMLPPGEGSQGGVPADAFFGEEEATTRQSADTLVLAPPSSGSNRTSAQVTIIAGPNVGRAFSINRRETVLGRGREAHVFIDDAGASRAHARIVVTDDGSYVLEDLKSRNGTFVGGRRIERAELNSGDRISIGSGVTVSFAILDAQAER